MNTFSTRQIADRVKGDLIGRDDISIHGIDQLNTATSGQLGFVREERYAKLWHESHASAVLANQNTKLEPGDHRAVITVSDVDHALATVLEMFQPPSFKPAGGIHPAATIEDSAEIDSTAAIGPGCVIGPHARIGAKTILHANVFIGGQAIIGDECQLFAGVVIGDRCELGHHVTIHSNSVIGADGFGYLPDPAARNGTGLRKVPQIGYVKVGNHVEIGSCTCIDRGKFSATIIGDGSKIDNLCQIAHNCQIGRSCIIAGQCGLAGSVTLKDGVMLGGSSGVNDHLTVGAGAKIGSNTGVTKNMPPGVVWSGYPAHDFQDVLREAVAIRKLPDLIKQVRAMSKLIKSENH